MSAAAAIRRVALVTGGNKGIGFEIVRALARSDPHMTVLLGARDGARGAASAQALSSSLPNVQPLAIDVASLPSIEAAASQVQQSYGGLDILVNNAGVFLKGNADTGGKPQDVDQTMAVNYFGVRDCASKFMPLMRHNGRSENASGQQPTATAASSSAASLSLALTFLGVCCLRLLRIVSVSSELASSTFQKMSAERRAAFEKPDLTVAEVRKARGLQEITRNNEPVSCERVIVVSHLISLSCGVL